MVCVGHAGRLDRAFRRRGEGGGKTLLPLSAVHRRPFSGDGARRGDREIQGQIYDGLGQAAPRAVRAPEEDGLDRGGRSEEHTSELQSLMRSSYAVFCLKKKKK